MRAEKRILPALAGLCLGLLPAWFSAPLDAQAQRVDEIQYPALPSSEVPQPQRFELDNGMVLLLLEDDELPLVEGQALIRTGDRWEPADKVGLAGMVGQVLRSGGTTTRPSDELDDLLEDKAAQIETSIGAVRGLASLSCLSKDLPDVLAIFADILRNPAFEEDKLQVAKTQAISGIARQNDSPQQILFREFQEVIYGGDSPYARSPTYATMGSIERQDLVDWHSTYFHPDRVILGLSGDFDAQKVVALAKEVFGDWARGPQGEEPEAALRSEAAPGIYFVEKNDVNQSNIQIGHLGLRRDHPDYYALEVLNQLFGGSFGSRLFSNVRSKKGLAYAVSGGMRTQWDYPGAFAMFTSTKTETTVAGVEALLEEARNLTAQPPTSEEISKAKASILNSFVFRFDSNSEILGQQLTLEYFGYPTDWLERYRRGIEAVTESEVRASVKHIRPEDFTIFVVGKSEGTDQPLSVLGEVQMVDITIPEPEAEAVEVTEAGKAQATELLAKAVEAMGGASAIAAVQNVSSQEVTTLQTPQGAMELKSKSIIAFPDRIRAEATLPFGTISQILDGEEGYMKTPQGVQPLPPSMAADMGKRLRRELFYYLQQRDSDGFSATATGEAEVDGTPVVQVYTEWGDLSQTLGIDPATGQVLSISYRGTGMGGAPGELHQVRSDFREVSGVQVPFSTTTTFNGEPMSSTTTESMELNVEVDDTLFAKPEE